MCYESEGHGRGTIPGNTQFVDGITSMPVNSGDMGGERDRFTSNNNEDRAQNTNIPRNRQFRDNHDQNQNTGNYDGGSGRDPNRNSSNQGGGDRNPSSQSRVSNPGQGGDGGWGVPDLHITVEKEKQNLGLQDMMAVPHMKTIKFSLK